MDFGLREWLFIFGLLVIAGILFDGWRRMGGRSKIRFKLERNLSDLPEEGGSDELLGPPRVVNRNERAEPSFGGDAADTLAGDDQWHEPEQVGLDLSQCLSRIIHSQVFARRIQFMLAEGVFYPDQSVLNQTRGGNKNGQNPVRGELQKLDLLNWSE